MIFSLPVSPIIGSYHDPQRCHAFRERFYVTKNLQKAYLWGSRPGVLDSSGSPISGMPPAPRRMIRSPTPQAWRFGTLQLGAVLAKRNLQWCKRHVSMGFLWVFCGFSVGFLWVFCGFSVGLLVFHTYFFKPSPLGPSGKDVNPRQNTSLERLSTNCDVFHSSFTP